MLAEIAASTRWAAEHHTTFSDLAQLRCGGGSLCLADFSSHSIGLHDLPLLLATLVDVEATGTAAPAKVLIRLPPFPRSDALRPIELHKG
jgi:hypothetical protein